MKFWLESFGIQLQLSVSFSSHHPRHPFLCLDEFVPVEPLVRHSERFATVALDAVLGHQLFERRSDLRERHFVFSRSSRFECLLEQGHVPADKVLRRVRRQLRLDSLLLSGIAELPARGDRHFRRLALSEAEHREPGLAYTLGQHRVVPVAGGYAEVVDPTSVQNIHRVDDKRHVGRVLSRRLTRSLHQPERMHLGFLLPFGQRPPGPIAVDAPDDKRTVLLRKTHDLADPLVGYVVAVDQYGYRRFVFGSYNIRVSCHDSSVLIYEHTSSVLIRFYLPTVSFFYHRYKHVVFSTKSVH